MVVSDGLLEALHIRSGLNKKELLGFVNDLRVPGFWTWNVGILSS